MFIIYRYPEEHTNHTKVSPLILKPLTVLVLAAKDCSKVSNSTDQSLEVDDFLCSVGDKRKRQE